MSRDKQCYCQIKSKMKYSDITYYLKEQEVALLETSIKAYIIAASKQTFASSKTNSTPKVQNQTIPELYYADIKSSK